MSISATFGWSVIGELLTLLVAVCSEKISSSRLKLKGKTENSTDFFMVSSLSKHDCILMIGCFKVNRIQIIPG